MNRRLILTSLVSLAAIAAPFAASAATSTTTTSTSVTKAAPHHSVTHKVVKKTSTAATPAKAK